MRLCINGHVLNTEPISIPVYVYVQSCCKVTEIVAGLYCGHGVVTNKTVEATFWDPIIIVVYGVVGSRHFSFSKLSSKLWKA